MSFGYSVGDILSLTQLAWRTVQNTRKACGEHDDLTREVTSLHSILRRVQEEASKPNSIFQQVSVDTTEELRTTIEGCGKVLAILDKIVIKYNGLTEEQRAGRRLWSKVRFGNGEMGSLSDLRLKLLTYTSGITLLLNLTSMDSQGRVEQQMNSQGSDLKEIRQSLNWITASLSTGNEGSILTTYAGDDKAVWKELRRELITEGYSSNLIAKHKALIMAYVKELGERGVLDEIDVPDELLPFTNFNTGPTLISQNTVPLGDRDGDALRHLDGIPVDEAALTEELNKQKLVDKEPIEMQHVYETRVGKESVQGRPAEELDVEEYSNDKDTVEEQPLYEIAKDKFLKLYYPSDSSTEGLVESDGHQGKFYTGDSKPDPIPGTALKDSSNNSSEPQKLTLERPHERKVETSGDISKIKRLRCRVCNSTKDLESVSLECYHRLCTACLINTFVNSLSDAKNMPPRCCSREIPLPWEANISLGLDLQSLWSQKHEESTAERIGIYCPNKGCGEYIDRAPPMNLSYFTSGTRKCPRCEEPICRFCNHKLNYKHRTCIAQLQDNSGEPERAAKARQCREMGLKRTAEKISRMKKKYARPMGRKHS